MSVKLIETRLQEYNIANQRDELNALKEIMQEIALSALNRAGFFKLAAFQGGSCLRIIHKLNRFSEDLDFTLLQPDRTFIWQPFLVALEHEFSLYELDFKVTDRSQADKIVKLAFLKDSSFGQVLSLTYPRSASEVTTIKIKLEIDTNPPTGSTVETKFLDYPYIFSITVQDLPSLFAGKCHALLCRPYTKGRDWFDLVWYIAKQVKPNYQYLQRALYQTGPWQGQNLYVTGPWLVDTLHNRLTTLDWNTAKADASYFLDKLQQRSLHAWGQDYFKTELEKMAQTLAA